MASPAQPKKIVAPTVSQMNAEFVTQVRLGGFSVCERPADIEVPRFGGGIFLGTGSTHEASVRQCIHQTVFTLCSVSATVRRAGDAMIKKAALSGVQVPGKADKNSCNARFAVLESVAVAGKEHLSYLRLAKFCGGGDAGLIVEGGRGFFFF